MNRLAHWTVARRGLGSSETGARRGWEVCWLAWAALSLSVDHPGLDVGASGKNYGGTDRRRRSAFLDALFDLAFGPDVGLVVLVGRHLAGDFQKVVY